MYTNKYICICIAYPLCTYKCKGKEYIGTYTYDWHCFSRKPRALSSMARANPVASIPCRHSSPSANRKIISRNVLSSQRDLCISFLPVYFSILFASRYHNLNFMKISAKEGIFIFFSLKRTSYPSVLVKGQLGCQVNNLPV